ncbi:hypothetical protein [Saccharopolyspora sp. NPDC049426]|uniref:hypothetical protein n=1 Tax=Saccharopolyspora sp. NPDC049426 TaxID=3155652 RepID=UPI003436F5CE
MRDVLGFAVDAQPEAHVADRWNIVPYLAAQAIAALISSNHGACPARKGFEAGTETSVRNLAVFVDGISAPGGSVLEPASDPHAGDAPST